MTAPEQTAHTGGRENGRSEMTDAEDLLLEIANSMSKDFVDPVEHANWCVEAAREYFTKKAPPLPERSHA